MERVRTFLRENRRDPGDAPVIEVDAIHFSVAPDKSAPQAAAVAVALAPPAESTRLAVADEKPLELPAKAIAAPLTPASVAKARAADMVFAEEESFAQSDAAWLEPLSGPAADPWSTLPPEKLAAALTA